jgi:rRNA maturation RNase YbeY
VRIAGPPRRKGVPAPDRRLLRRRAARLLGALGRETSELSVALLADPEMAALNARHRRTPRPTDVLSFSLLEGPGVRFRERLLGDVVIGVETAARQARRARRRLDDEVARLLVHGVLHLLGFDHARPADAGRMRREERRLLRGIGE